MVCVKYLAADSTPLLFSLLLVYENHFSQLSVIMVIGELAIWWRELEVLGKGTMVCWASAMGWGIHWVTYMSFIIQNDNLSCSIWGNLTEKRSGQLPKDDTDWEKVECKHELCDCIGGQSLERRIPASVWGGMFWSSIKVLLLPLQISL